MKLSISFSKVSPYLPGFVSVTALAFAIGSLWFVLQGDSRLPFWGQETAEAPKVEAAISFHPEENNWSIAPGDEIHLQFSVENVGESINLSLYDVTLRENGNEVEFDSTESGQSDIGLKLVAPQEFGIHRYDVQLTHGEAKFSSFLTLTVADPAATFTENDYAFPPRIFIDTIDTSEDDAVVRISLPPSDEPEHFWLFAKPWNANWYFPIGERQNVERKWTQAFDRAEAKRLLEEAGYPDGFTSNFDLVLTGSDERATGYLEDYIRRYEHPAALSTFPPGVVPLDLTTLSWPAPRPAKVQE